MKNCVCLRVHIFSRIISFLYFTFWLLWHPSLKRPFPAVVCWWLGKLQGQHQLGHCSCSMVWMWTLQALTLPEALLVNFHLTHLTSNSLCYCCLWAKLQCQATGVPGWVRKQWGSPRVLPAHTQHSLFQKHRQLLWLHQGHPIQTPHQPGALY